MQESLEIKLTNRLIQDISSVLLSGKTIKKLYLYYDSKAGKKKWRYEFDNSAIINQQIPKQFSQEKYTIFQKRGSLPETASGVLSTFLQKLRLTFHVNDPANYVNIIDFLNQFNVYITDSSIS